MRRLRLALAALAFASLPAIAQQVFQVYVPLGFQQITPVLPGTTLTVPAGARWANICVDSPTAVRYRDDGTAPTATVGMPLSAAAALPGPQCIQYSGALVSTLIPGVATPAQIQFTTAIGTPVTLNISYYR